MKRVSLLIAVVMLLGTAAYAQTTPAEPATPPAPSPANQAPPAPAAPAPAVAVPSGARIAVIQFDVALAENSVGRKAMTELQTAYEARQTELDKINQEIQTLQADLQTQARVLGEAARLEKTRRIETLTTEINRKGEDYQREIQNLQGEKLGPIADLVTQVLRAYAAEMGYAAVFDVTAETNNIIYFQPVADITTEIIRRVDAEAARTPPAPTPGG